MTKQNIMLLSQAIIDKFVKGGWIELKDGRYIFREGCDFAGMQVVARDKLIPPKQRSIKDIKEKS